MATESMVVDAAKRAPTRDSLAEEEQSSSPMKKQKVEEEEKIYSETHVPELGCKPQWDVDSYDGREYESDPEDRKLFSDDEEYDKYRRERRRAFDSKVIDCFIFLPDSFRKKNLILGIYLWTSERKLSN